MQVIDHLYSHYLKHRSISTDSRHIPKGSIFFALRGERFDGNEYALSALAQGASLAVVDNPIYCSDSRCYLVEDTLKTLQQLAQWHRQKWSFPVIAVAGSNGKTTTKELLKAVLATTYVAHATQGNLNNHIGVPLTLLSMPPNTNIAVIEIGANHPNEIAELCQIAQPTHGLVTNIGKEHLEGFGDIEGVQKAEGELYDYLAHMSGMAFVNIDDQRVVQIATPVQQQCRYSTATNIAETWLHIDKSSTLLQLHYENRPIRTQLVGHYNASNVAAALAVGKYFGVNTDHAIRAIESYVPQNKRSQIVSYKNNNTIILDAYNANPSSMEAALDSFDALLVDKKMVVLGDMREVGRFSNEEHQAIVERLQNMSLQRVVLVGEAFGNTDFPSHFCHFPDAATARQWFAEQDLNHFHILLKASRGIALEQIIEEKQPD